MKFLLLLLPAIFVPLMAEEHEERGEVGSPPYDYESLTETDIRVLSGVKDCKMRSQNGDTITWHYTGYLVDGTVFDSSVERQPYWATLGTGSVILGVDKGMQNMCVGEKRKMIIPPHEGYGERGYPGSIPGNAVLIFDVELLKIDRPEKKEL